jgi:hypothetical protein
MLKANLWRDPSHVKPFMVLGVCRKHGSNCTLCSLPAVSDRPILAPCRGLRSMSDGQAKPHERARSGRQAA